MLVLDTKKYREVCLRSNLSNIIKIIWKNLKNLMYNIKDCLKELIKIDININLNLNINNYKDYTNYNFSNNKNKKI